MWDLNHIVGADQPDEGYSRGGTAQFGDCIDGKACAEVDLEGGRADAAVAGDEGLGGGETVGQWGHICSRFEGVLG